jgi:hypothetical protein
MSPKRPAYSDPFGVFFNESTGRGGNPHERGGALSEAPQGQPGPEPQPDGSPTHTAQESRLFHNFAAQVQSGSLSPLWPEVALTTQQFMQACYESTRA